MYLRCTTSAEASCSYPAHQPTTRVVLRNAQSSYAFLRRPQDCKGRKAIALCNTKGQTEKFWSVTDVLKQVSNIRAGSMFYLYSRCWWCRCVYDVCNCPMQARQEGSESLVFQDNEEGEVWDFESRVASQPVDLKGQCLSSL